MDIASYEDDNTPNVAAGDTNGVTKSLENMSEYEWFKINILESNADKYQLVVSFNENVSIRESEYEIRNSVCEKLLGVRLDNS